MQYDFFTRTFEPVEEDKDSGKEETEVKQPEEEGKRSQRERQRGMWRKEE